MLSHQNHGPARLYAALSGPIQFALLDWALTDGIFDLCETPQQASAIANAKAYDPDQCCIALRALVAAGYLVQKGDALQRFVVAEDIRPFVTSKSPTSLVENLKSMAALRHEALADISKYLQREKPAPQRPLFDADHWDRAYRSLKQFHQGIASSVMTHCVRQLPEWPLAKRLLDIGPGSATLARDLLKMRPDLEITLFDLPPVADRISKDTADLNIQIHPGSYNDDLPKGSFDVIWCSMTLYFHDAGIEDLIARLADRLAPGGVLVSLHEALHDGRTGPSEHVIGRLMPALRHSDTSFSAGEIAGAMQSAGLTRPTSNDLLTPFGQMRLDAARKE